MKPTLLLALLLIAIASRAQQEKDDTGNRIKAFYSQYITVMEHLPPQQQFSRDTLNKYCTISFLEKLPSLTGQCDCDPIVCAQDYDGTLVETMTITASGNNKFTVLFPDYKWGKYCLQVTVKKEQGEWKINEVKDMGN